MTEMLFLCVRISRISAEAVAKCLIDVDDAAAGNLGIHFLIKSVLSPSLRRNRLKTKISCRFAVARRQMSKGGEGEQTASVQQLGKKALIRREAGGDIPRISPSRPQVCWLALIIAALRYWRRIS